MLTESNWIKFNEWHTAKVRHIMLRKSNPMLDMFTIYSNRFTIMIYYHWFAEFKPHKFDLQATDVTDIKKTRSDRREIGCLCFGFCCLCGKLSEGVVLIMWFTQFEMKRKKNRPLRLVTLLCMPSHDWNILLIVFGLVWFGIDESNRLCG